MVGSYGQGNSFKVPLYHQMRLYRHVLSSMGTGLICVECPNKGEFAMTYYNTDTNMLQPLFSITDPVALIGFIHHNE